MTRVLITGPTGFLGRHCLTRLELVSLPNWWTLGFQRQRQPGGRYRYVLAEAYRPRWPGRAGRGISARRRDLHRLQDNKQNQRSIKKGDSQDWPSEAERWTARLSAWKRSGGKFWEPKFAGPRGRIRPAAGCRRGRCSRRRAMPDDPVQLAFGWSAGEDQGRFPRNPRPALPVPFRNGVRMGYSLGQAARAAGRSKTTIHRTIKSGRLSAARTADGYEIDPAELERVLQPLATGGADAAVNAAGDFAEGLDASRWRRGGPRHPLPPRGARRGSWRLRVHSSMWPPSAARRAVAADPRPRAGAAMMM